MDRFFYSPITGEVRPDDIKENYLIKCSFNDKNIPHFAKTGIAIISKVYNDSIEITLNKNQKFIDTSLFGENINLTSGLLIKSIFENDEIAIFEIPKKYIWCVSNEKTI